MHIKSATLRFKQLFCQRWVTFLNHLEGGEGWKVALLNKGHPQQNFLILPQDIHQIQDSSHAPPLFCYLSPRWLIVTAPHAAAAAAITQYLASQLSAIRAGRRTLQGHEADEQAEVCTLIEGICQSANFQLHTHRNADTWQWLTTAKAHFNWWIFCPLAKQMSAAGWKISEPSGHPAKTRWQPVVFNIYSCWLRLKSHASTWWHLSHMKVMDFQFAENKKPFFWPHNEQKMAHMTSFSPVINIKVTPRMVFQVGQCIICQCQLEDFARDRPIKSPD